MDNLIEKLRAKLPPDWNRRVLTLNDFYDLCSREGIHTRGSVAIPRGMYFPEGNDDFILLNPQLQGWQKVKTCFHEWAHALLHREQQGVQFDGGSDPRLDAEADIVALCALMPQRMMEGFTAPEIVKRFGYPAEMVAQRMMIYRQLGF